MVSAYTQIGGVGIDAFQWNGGLLSATVLPIWAKHLSLHTPGDGTLHVPCRNGTLAAQKTDWVIQGADGGVDIMPNSHFVKLYH